MTWLSHTTIATALVLPFAPQAIPIVVAGSTAPDWMEYVLKPFIPHLQHRKETHYLSFWAIAFAVSFVIDFHDLLFWFSFGGLTHILADSLTISGVPLSPYNRARFHLFGGAIKESGFYKFRTGGMAEYAIAFGLLFGAISISNFSSLLRGKEYFNVYTFNYGKLYDQKVIDTKEYKENRFKFF